MQSRTVCRSVSWGFFVALAIALNSAVTRAIEPPCWFDVGEAVVARTKDYSFVSERNKIKKSKAEWIRAIRRNPDLKVDLATLSDLEKLGLFEAYMEVQGIKPLANVQQIETKGTPAQKATLGEIIANLQKPLSGRDLAKAMTRLYRLQLEFDSKWLDLPEPVQVLRRWFLRLPEEAVRARLESQLIEDAGAFFYETGATTTKPPSGKIAIAKDTAVYVATNLLLYHLTGFTPLDAPIFPRINLLAFTDLFKRWVRTGDTRDFHQQYLALAPKVGVPIPRTGLTVARVDMILNTAVRILIFWRYYELANFLTSREGKFFVSLGYDLATKTREDWSNEELASFTHGDRVREMRDKYIRDGIEGYRLSRKKEPPKEYIDLQHEIWGSLEVEDLAAFMTAKDIEIYKEWFVHRTDFRWEKTLEHFKFKDEILRLRDTYVAKQLAERGSELDRSPYAIARLKDNFDYWDLEEAKNSLPLKDAKILEMWRELKKKIHIDEPKPK